MIMKDFFNILKTIWRRKFYKKVYYLTKTLDDALLSFFFIFHLWNGKTKEFFLLLIYHLMQDL